MLKKQERILEQKFPGIDWLHYLIDFRDFAILPWGEKGVPEA